VTLDAVNDSVIHPKVAADRLEAVPPCMVGLDTFVCHDRSNDINHALVTALCEQRAIVGALDEAQQAREAFITSASQTVMPVVKIDGRPVGNGAPGLVASALRRDFYRHAEFS